MKTTRRTRNAQKFHPVQIAYFTARAAYEVAKEAYEAECKATGNVLWNGMPDADYDRIDAAREDIRAKHNLDALSTAKVKAERALIDWSVGVAITLAPSKRAELTELRDKVAYHPKIWEQLVDMGGRLAV
jgi:hypothetical protein